MSVLFWHFILLLVFYVSLRIVLYYHFRKNYDHFIPWIGIICLFVLFFLLSGLEDEWAKLFELSELNFPAQFLILTLPILLIYILAYRHERLRLHVQQSA